MREHQWEVTAEFEEPVTIRWECTVCGFATHQEEATKPETFELTTNEQDCDLQLVKRIMEA